MQIIIPMSGVGKRFLEAGYKDPKPLIKVEGKPIVEHVVSMFPGETDFTFICNSQHLAETNMKDELKKIAPEGKIIEIPNHKLGPVYAVQCIAESIDNNKPTIVNYCDFYQSWDWKNFKETVHKEDCDGAIPCYSGFHPHLIGPNCYASCKTDEKNYLLEIREKHSFTDNKMDCPQSSGTYYFKNGGLVKKYFQQLMDEKIDLNGEYYVSLVYNLLVRDNLKTLIYFVDQFCQWGTPQDLEEYLYWSDYFLKGQKQ